MENNKIDFENGVINGERNRLKGFKLITEKPIAFKKVEFEIDMPELPEKVNVYKQYEFAVTMNIESQSGKKIKADAFYFEEYAFNDDMSLKAFGQEGRTDKKPCLRIRINPKETGLWKFTVTMTVLGEKLDTLSGCIEVADGGLSSRLARVEPKRKQVFTSDATGPFPAIGECLGWNANPRNKNIFAQYTANRMRLMSNCGANYTRVWEYFEVGGRIRKKVYDMCQDGSAMWDLIFEAAEEYGFYISFVLLTHGEVSRFIDACFDMSIWHKNNGGFIEEAEEFFTNRDTIDAYKCFLRYIISRWGYTESILCWELCNEVDHTSAVCLGHLDDVKMWIHEMSDYLRQNDPYGHMVTANAGYPQIQMAISNSLDFVYFHLYNSYSLKQPMNLCLPTWRAFGRPVIIGESGIDGPAKLMNNQRIGEDLMEMIHGHFSCLFGSSGGTGMSWWWEEAEKHDGYRSFKAVSRLAERIPWDDVEMENISTESVLCSNHRIDAQGYRGAGYAYLWFYDNNVSPVSRYCEILLQNESARIRLDDGSYNLCWIDLFTGDTVKETTAETENGYLTLDMPDWSKYIAVSVEKV